MKHNKGKKQSEQELAHLLLIDLQFFLLLYLRSYYLYFPVVTP